MQHNISIRLATWLTRTLRRTFVPLGLGTALLWSASVPARGDTNIVWCDEFNGTALDTNKWVPLEGIINGTELQYYTGSTQNVYVSNGVLHIVARQQSTNGYAYTSAQVMTTGLFWKTYGRFEFRGKLPMGAAFHPAFWMLPENSPYGHWPNAGEIDVMEQPGFEPTEVTGTIHFGNNNSFDMYSYNFSGGQSITNFHVYRVDWTTNSMSWYIDGFRYQTQSNWFCNVGNTGSTYPYPAPFNVPFYLIIDLAIGGSYLNNPSTNLINSMLPNEMQVDYVRVWDQTPPLAISTVHSNGTVLLRWPTNIVCHLQMRTNSIAGPGSTNWVDVAGAGNPYGPPAAGGPALYRLQSP